MENATQILLNQVMHLYIQRSAQLMSGMKAVPGHGGGLLWTVKNNEGLSQKELAKRLGVKPPSITAMLKKLEAENYIIKKQDEKDQRIVRIYITPEGEEAAASMNEVMENLGKETFSNMSEQEVMLLRRFLLQMKENLSKNNLSK